ncbi:portal protein [Phenylobacterium immobile]|uniref:portal protein n=1 Tax=Phenylobacterium immobile TaxID=21 RepID=UPI000A9E9D06|nr:portal protein [Phenylobacterium immobile]
MNHRLSAEGAAAPDHDDTETFLAEVRRRFQEGVDADRENREVGLDDLKFLTGEGQWDERVEAQRLKKGLPCLRINTLPQFVGQVAGDIRLNKPAIRVRPAEDGDRQVAEVRQGLIRFIENRSNAGMVYSMAGEDQVACGLGHFRIGLEYAADDAFDQDIRIRHVPNPFGVVWDPQSTDPTGADARWCFVVDEMDRASFKAAYPDAEGSSPTATPGEGGWTGRDTIRVTEYWEMVERPRTLAVVLRGPQAQPQILDITGREEAFEGLILTGPDGRPRMRKAMRRTAQMWLTNGHELLEPEPYELPISRLPIFKVTGREVRTGERRYRFGLIRFAKDPLRMKNLWRSSAAAWLAQAPRQQWLLHATDEAEADRYRNASQTGDPVLIWSGQTPPQRLDPPSSPAALLQEAQFNDQDIKDVTGLHDASLGMRSNETSGRAILARERQGDVATFMYHDNLRLSIKACGEVANELIPLVYDTPRTVMILGDDETLKQARVNDSSADGGLIDLKIGKYDVVVESGPSFSTRRVEAAESMMAFVQAVPQAAALAGDLIARAQDWPSAEVIGERLKKALPPGLVEEPRDAGLPDPRVMAQQQRAMQIQQAAQAAAMRKAELELAEQAARARLAEAQAARAEMEVQRLASQQLGLGAPGQL